MTSSAPSSREAYTPAIPSPLNPTSPQTPPRRHRRTFSRVARRSGGPVSPTQRLMRQKAAAAWRSLALRNAIPNNTPAPQGGGRQSLAAEPPQGEEAGIIENGPWTPLNEGFGGMGLGIVAVDMEKQLLASGGGFGMGPPRGLSSAPFDYARRPRDRGVITTGRVMLALGGMLCLLGVFSAFCSRRGGSL